MKLDKDWCLNTAKAEGSAEIGAGRLCTPEQCEEDGGHVFEVIGEPPYRCTFCRFSHEETDSGSLIRPNDK